MSNGQSKLDYKTYVAVNKLLGKPAVAERTFRHMPERAWRTTLNLKLTGLGQALSNPVPKTPPKKK